MMLNSFWSADRKEIDGQAEDNELVASIRKLLVIIAVILGAIFQVRELYRQPYHWDLLDGNRCYRYELAYGYDNTGTNTHRRHAIIGTLWYAFIRSGSLYGKLGRLLEKFEDRIYIENKHQWLEAKSGVVELCIQIKEIGTIHH